LDANKRLCNYTINTAAFKYFTEVLPTLDKVVLKFTKANIPHSMSRCV